jgi:hypothetical protein
MQPSGVMLRWPSSRGPQEAGENLVRFYRRLIASGSGQLDSSSIDERNLTLEANENEGSILDRSARPGNGYEYTAQLLIRLIVGGHTFELAGGLSPPVWVSAANSPQSESRTGADSSAESGCPAPKF